MISYIQS